ncbi:unnamed protein product [Closterium sp. Naga37s-1]|nr:unnamed protein product [Closterium sp. Naga37s-1]
MILKGELEQQRAGREQKRASERAGNHLKSLSGADTSLAVSVPCLKWGHFLLDPLRLHLGPLIALGASGEVRRGRDAAPYLLVSPLRTQLVQAPMSPPRHRLLRPLCPRAPSPPLSVSPCFLSYTLLSRPPPETRLPSSCCSFSPLSSALSLSSAMTPHVHRTSWGRAQRAASAWSMLPAWGLAVVIVVVWGRDREKGWGVEGKMGCGDGGVGGCGGGGWGYELGGRREKKPGKGDKGMRGGGELGG